MFSELRSHASANVRLALAHVIPVLLILTAQSAGASHTDCSDGFDNDRDGRIDYPRDEQCGSSLDDSEGPSGGGVFVDITDGRDVAKPGSSLAYKITLRSDREEQGDVTVRFHLPHQTNLLDVANGGRRIGSYVQWDAVTVGGGQTRFLYATVEVNPYATPNLLLVAEVEAAGERDSDTTRVTDDLIGVSPIRISVSDGRQTVVQREVLHYDISVRNIGTGDRVFTLRTRLPEELGFVSASDDYLRNGRSIEWRNQVLRPGETRGYALEGRIEEHLPGFANIRLRVYGNGAGELATDDTFVHRGPMDREFSIAVRADADEAGPGDEITYTLTVENASDALATDVHVADALPIYTEFVSATEGGRFVGGNEVRWDGITIAPRGERTLRVTARVRSNAPEGASLMNSAVVRGVRSTVVSTVGAFRGRKELRRANGDHENVFLRKVADRTEVQPGGTVIYTIVVRNTAGRTIRDIEVIDRLDELTMTLVRGAEDAERRGGRLVWTIGELEAGGTWQRRYAVAISADVPEGAVLKNVVSVGGDDVASLSLAERVRTVGLPVLEDMPEAGAGVDAMVALLTALISAVPAVLQRRRVF